MTASTQPQLPAYSLHCYMPGTLNGTDKLKLGQFRSMIWREQGHTISHCTTPDSWLEGADSDAYIWLAESQGHIIATARMNLCTDLAHLPEQQLYQPISNQLPTPLATWGRLAVATQWRNQGLATHLIKVRLILAKELGCRTVVLDCPVSRIAAMQAHHFDVLLPPQPGILFPGIQFVVMGRML
ncbi:MULTISPECIES: GNAT family N-acetyltransferase [unclassified Pseudoalteromonas]|uniref:GNAT family N-acetyltransferase n=1 Tax=unclassified Pseudoalteromonas TaxID=194690 RepID=UPI00209734F0|nr:GNAT family N-acetyltransferase [Pseudoalteromonas sp. XMcav2-N]MCO7190870.1 GNAT family N-acetyltransferase [Pseudoalteromonas sp. XMcav2-N]